MREITKELEINMSQTESALLSFLESNGGGGMNDTQIIENHPQDSRVKLTDTVQSLTGRMGTGGVTRQW